MPTEQRNSPTPAIYMLTQNIVMIMPKINRLRQTVIRSFRPTKSPTKVRAKKPITTPTYIMV